MIPIPRHGRGQARALLYSIALAEQPLTGEEDEEDEDWWEESVELVNLLSENLSIYAGDPTRDFRPETVEILKQFDAAFRRDPTDYMD
jgi:hypothetical protein